jgi:hypothetical protein
MNLAKRLRAALKQASESWRNTKISYPGDWMDEAPMSEEAKGRSVMNLYPASGAMLDDLRNIDFDPEEYTKKEFAFNEESSKGAGWLHRQLMEGKADIGSATIFQAKINGAGKMQKAIEGKRYPYRFKKTFGTEAFKAQLVAGDSAMQKLREASAGSAKFKEDFGDDGSGGGFLGPYDPNQYTEYAPLMGGYFFSQLYLYDMLKMHAYAFEAWNHNPLAHRIINGLSQYSVGRRCDWQINKKAQNYDRKSRAWEDFAKKINLRHRLSKYWSREKNIFGELFLDKRTWQSLHPATIWEIVTEPTDISNVYYFYRSYPTQYQMYSGYSVPGAPGAKNVPSQRYVVEQIPYSQIIHIKNQCTSFEKRGRSILFPVLGWLKRVKDLYQAQITRAQMQSDYAWDVTIKGGAQDVSSFKTQNSCIPRGTGNTFVHNEAVTRTPMPMATGAGRGGDSTVENVLSFIATSVGFPKEFFNIISQGGGNRATALVSSEPFTKVIEDDQADWEYLLHEMYDEVMRQNNLQTDPDDIEFIFPSATKDTTSEAIKNIITGYSEGFISKERAGNMYAGEMDITAYNYEDEQKTLKDEKVKGDIDLVGAQLPPAGRMGGSDPGSKGDGSIGDSPIHGSGKEDLEDSLDNL